jgi:hypothetical protein
MIESGFLTPTGWPVDLGDDEILEGLLAQNLERDPA